MVCHIFCFSLSDATLRELCDGDSSCLNGSPHLVSMVRIKDDFDLENFEESSGMKFKMVVEVWIGGDMIMGIYKNEKSILTLRFIYSEQPLSLYVVGPFLGQKHFCFT